MINKYKNIKISILSLFILIITTPIAFAQLFYHPQNPLSVKWKQLKTPELHLIYPEEIEHQTLLLAAKIKAFKKPLYQDLNPQPNRYPTLLQNRGINSNAFVQIAPRLSHFYTTPEQGFDSQNWLSNLAIHELRHMVHFDYLTKPQKFPLLQELKLAYLGIRIPLWFLEGDAVFHESYLTQAGRGKQAEWIMPFRATLLEKEKLSYTKAFFGSNKHHTPGYYQLGYLMQSLMVEQHGPEVIPQIFQDLAQNKVELFQFSKSLKRSTGLNREEWYKKNLDTLYARWSKQADSNTIQASAQDLPQAKPKPISAPSKFATDYLFPFPINPTQTLSLKQGKNTIPSLVLLGPELKEEHLSYIGFQEKAWIHYAAGKVVWAERRTHPRYLQESYSVICIYDLKSKKTKQITHKTRYFSPSLSSDGKKIVVVEQDLKLQSHLVEISSSTGQVIQKHSPLPNYHLENPSYDEQNQRLVFLSVNDQGRSIEILQLGPQSAKSQRIFGPAHWQISNPKFNQDKIYFNSHLNGLDNIYELSLQNSEIFALSASKYGAFHAQISAQQDSLVHSNYDFMGYQIQKAVYQRQPVGKNYFVALAKSNTPIFNDEFLKQFDTTNLTCFKQSTKPYSNFQDLIKFHSLSLKQERPSQNQLILRSENLLNTLYWENGIAYEGDMRQFSYKSEFNWRAFYPIIQLRYDNRPRQSSFENKSLEKDETKYLLNADSWRENRIQFGINLPLRFYQQQRQFAFNLEIQTSYTKRYRIQQADPDFLRQIAFSIAYTLNFSHAWRKSSAEIAPKFAQSIALKYAHQPFSKVLKGELYTFQSSFYFPGILARHSFSLHANLQRGSGLWSNQVEINPIYGYYQSSRQKPLKQVLLMHYRFPVAYPDLNLSKLAYIKQINLGLFNHYENPSQIKDLTQPRSYGLEVLTKMHILEYQPLIDFGARLIFINQSKKQNPILEFTFNYSL